MDSLPPSISALLTNMTSGATSSPKRKASEDSNFGQDSDTPLIDIWKRKHIAKDHPDSDAPLIESWKRRRRAKDPTPESVGPWTEYLARESPQKPSERTRSSAKTPTKHRAARKAPVRRSTLARNKGQRRGIKAVRALPKADIYEEQLDAQTYLGPRESTPPEGVRSPESVHALSLERQPTLFSKSISIIWDYRPLLSQNFRTIMAPSVSNMLT